MDLDDIVKKEHCNTSEDYLDVFVKNELEPEVLIKTEVTDDDIGPADENETVFIAHSNGYSTNKCH